MTSVQKQVFFSYIGEVFNSVWRFELRSLSCDELPLSKARSILTSEPCVSTDAASFRPSDNDCLLTDVADILMSWRLSSCRNKMVTFEPQ